MSFLATAGTARGANAPTISSNTWAGQVLVATRANSGDALEWYDCGDPSSYPNCRDTGTSGADSPAIVAGDAYYVVETLADSSTVDSDSSGAVTSSPPTATTMISGAPYAPGHTLTAAVSWQPQMPDSVVDEWQSCDASGNCTAVSSTPQYSITASDENHTLFFTETATYGPATLSTSTTPMPLVPEPGTPSISGVTQQGSTLTASTGAWNNSPSFTYEWDCSGCSAPLQTGSSATYTLQPSDVGKTISVIVTGLNASGSATATAGPTATVVPLPPANTAAPSISGSAAFGQTLTANVGGWSAAPDNPTSFAYQWESCSLVCNEIPGATGATYHLADGDVGTQLAVVVTGIDAGGPGAVVQSPRTAVVTAPTTLSLTASAQTLGTDAPVTFVGAVTSGADTVSPSGTVTFTRDGQPIAGCTDLRVSGVGLGITVTCQTSFVVSSPRIGATFTPDAGSPLLGSSAAPQTINVVRGVSKVTLDVPRTAGTGTALTYTASVSPGLNRTGPVFPGGEVAFLDHGKPIHGCGGAVVTDGGATCTMRYRQAGLHSIQARYLGDANFMASHSHATTVRISAPRPKPKPKPKPKPTKKHHPTSHHHPVKPLGAITATMQWTFHYTPHYTRILALALHGARRETKVMMRCTGSGCPFKTRTRVIGAAARCHPTHGHRCPSPGSFNLEPSFARRRLRVHTSLVVAISRPRYVGKFYRFTIRGGREPRISISCLAIGSHRPGVGCSAR